MSTAPDLLARIRIASPCNARWDEMSGDDRCRLCALCDKNVYDLSTMTRDEAVDLIRDTEGKICGRLYRRPDGTVLTADCKVGARAARRPRRRAIAGVLTGLMAVMGSVVGVSLATQPETNAATLAVNPVPGWIQDLKIWLGLASPPPPEFIMGDICIEPEVVPAPPAVK